ncbi:MAG: class I SAM-dependent methyltransferase, partial [Deltaproteobacteria bacterium]
MKTPVAKFTGERPGWGRDFDYDESRHLAAYAYAYGQADGRDVLDAGCGEGFGTHRMADVARSVTGIDYSADAVSACRDTWQRSNLSFRQVDLTAPGDFTERFDLVLNFQVLEHIDEPLPFLLGLRDRLRPDGMLILTTP